MPASKDETVSGEDAPVAVRVVPPLVDVQVAVYPVTAVPPFEAGAENVNVPADAVAVASVIEGAPGAARGLTVTVGLEYEPVPAELDAATRKM